MREPVFGRRTPAAAFAFAFAYISAVGVGAAAMPESTRLFTGASSCPDAAAVFAEIETLVPADRLARRLAGVQAPVVQLVDLGARYRVIAAGNVREYRDDARDCGYRARVAAVFVALTVDPPAAPAGVAPVPPRRAAPAPPAVPLNPENPPNAPKPPNPPPSAGAGAPPPPPPDASAGAGGIGSAAPPAPLSVTAAAEPARRERLTALEVGAAVQIGLGNGDRNAAPGLAVHLARAAGAWHLLGGTVVSAPADSAVGGLRLRAWRLPVDLGVRRQFAGHDWLPYAEGGLSLAVVTAQALDLATNEKQTSLEVGLHAGVGICFGARWRLAPFAVVQAEYVPSPSAVFALPRGEIGHTSTLWLGAAAGASIDL